MTKKQPVKLNGTCNKCGKNLCVCPNRLPNGSILNTKAVRAILKSFPEVTWDRFTGSEGYYTFFGWIPRRHSSPDFMLIDIEDDEITRFRTSSKKYSKITSNRLGWTHGDCLRVENYFFRNVNCIKLGGDKDGK